MKTEFIKPKLVGKRFEEHSIPVEVLKDWVAFEGLIVGTARWLYLQENQVRRRAPRGFTDGFALHLSSVGEGSAMLTLDHVHPSDSFLPCVYIEWFEKARDLVMEVIQTVSEEKPIGALFPEALLSYFDQFGRSLREDERIEFVASHDSSVVYDTRVRKALVLHTASEYRTEAQFRGSISELDAEKNTLTFKLINGRKVSGTYVKEVKEQAIAALGGYGEFLVLIDGVVVRDQSDQIKTIEDISRIEFLDSLDVPARIEELALLQDGWFDGEGVAPSKDALVWFAHTWIAHWADNLPLPYLYPTPAGGLQAEWSLDTVSTLVEIDLANRDANLLVVRNDTGDIEHEDTLNLDVAEGWDKLMLSFDKNHLRSVP